LLGLGHTKVLLVGDSELHNDKFVGFRQVFEEKGISLPEHHFLNVVSWDHELTRQTYVAAKEFFNTYGVDSVSAVFAVSDIVAFGVTHALQELKIAIPSQVAVVGFDDIFIGQYTNPPLSSVSQPMEEIGRMAIKLLLDRLLKKHLDEVRTIELSPLLIPRESTVGI
jgi:LacI family transcriptional regulator